MTGPRRQEPDHFRDDREQGCEPDDREGPPSERHHFHPPDDSPTCAPQGGEADIELYDLIDFSMQVGNTGIVFVAGLTGWRESDGTARFITGAVDAAYRRAASTLAFMALISGQTFQFLRLTRDLTTAQAATLCGVTESEVIDWEDGSVPVPVSSWQYMADACTAADQRAGITWTPLPAPDFRPRKIRIYPDVPMPWTPPPPPCDPCGPCDPC